MKQERISVFVSALAHTQVLIVCKFYRTHVLFLTDFDIIVCHFQKTLQMHLFGHKIEADEILMIRNTFFVSLYFYVTLDYRLLITLVSVLNHIVKVCTLQHKSIHLSINQASTKQVKLLFILVFLIIAYNSSEVILFMFIVFSEVLSFSHFQFQIMVVMNNTFPFLTCFSCFQFSVLQKLLATKQVAHTESLEQKKKNNLPNFHILLCILA